MGISRINRNLTPHIRHRAARGVPAEIGPRCGVNPVRAPEDWPWSSYQAMLGRIAPPPWLHVQWLMSQFGNSPKAAAAAYVNHVRAGVNLPSVWQQLQGQMY